jgi:hypothetical protein
MVVAVVAAAVCVGAQVAGHRRSLWKAPQLAEQSAVAPTPAVQSLILQAGSLGIVVSSFATSGGDGHGGAGADTQAVAESDSDAL